MTRIDQDWLNSAATQSLLAMLTDAGHQAFVVGGAVRNALMGRPITDVDISTSAVPDEVMRLAGLAGFRSVPTGVEHGTVTVVVGDTPFEVTTFRRDVETDGRRAVVAFSTDLAEDAMRRDFTMNALYADAEGVVTDPVGGLAHLAERRVIFVGDAEQRIVEDYLRSLRFFRFTAEYGDAEAGIDAEALAAIAAHLDGLETLARERVGAEMAKLLATHDPAPALAAMQICGALLRILPGAAVEAVASLVHLEEMAGVSPDWVRRLAVIGAPDAADQLRMSKKDARRLDVMKRLVSSDASAAEVAWREGVDMAWSVALVRHASLSMQLPDDLGSQIEMGATAIFPLAATDLMPRLSGAELGEALSKAETLWITSGFSMDRDALLGAVTKPG